MKTFKNMLKNSCPDFSKLQLFLSLNAYEFLC